MIEVRALHTYYGLSHIIQGVDLTASAGHQSGATVQAERCEWIGHAYDRAKPS